MSFLFPKTPKPAPPVRMPVTGDADMRAAALRQQQQIQARSGRASTILSRSRGRASAGEPGTRTYSNSLLGQAG